MKEDHVKQRFEFCARFLSEDIDPQKILFLDENWFTNKLEQKVFNKKPNNIPELREVIQEALANICEAVVRRAVGNFRRRVNL